ncbi:MAG: hypothetical protein GY771_12660 [bacterium]|nr:hypothetical protein [bacterium]
MRFKHFKSKKGDEMLIRLIIAFFLLSVVSSVAYTGEDEFPVPDFDEKPDATDDTEPVYDEQYDPELWGVTLVKLWDLYELIPTGKVLQTRFEATKGMDYVIITRGKNLESYLRTPFDTSIYTPLEDPLVEAKIAGVIGDDEAIYNYLGNAKENGEYSVRVESKTHDREEVHMEVYVVNKWRRIIIEDEEETSEDEASPDTETEDGEEK